MKTLKPKIYVACLAAYNNGYLHGEWIDVNQNSETLHEQIRKMLATSPIPHAEEFAVHDFEDFGEYKIEEYESLNAISNIAAFVTEYSELGAAVLAHSGGDIDDATKLLEENYHG